MPAIAIAVLVLAELGVRLLDGPLHEPMVWRDREASAKAEQIAQLGRAGGADVVFVGSSMTNAAVDPAALSASLATTRPVYNAALNGVSAQSLDSWVEHVVLPNLDPRMLVVGLSSREVNANGLNQADELASFSRSPAMERLTGEGGWLGRLERQAADVSALVRYRTVLREPWSAFDRHLGPPRVDDILLPGGELRALTVFEGATYRITDDFRTRTTDRVLNDFAIGDDELEALQDLLARAEAQGVVVVVVVMPITTDAVAMHPHGASDYARFDAVLGDVAGTAPVIDLTGDFQDVDLFADPFHLNDRGRAMFTTALAAALPAT